MFKKTLFTLLPAVVLTIAITLAIAESKPQHETPPDVTLVPLKSILTDQIEFKPFPVDFGHIRPKKGYKLLSVFFAGLKNDMKIVTKDLSWTVNYHGKQASSIGVCIPLSAGGSRLLGSLGDNSAIIINNATKDTLIGLIFVVPASTTNFELKNPSGQLRKFSIDKKWIPTGKNALVNFNVKNLSFDIRDDNIEPRSPMKPIRIR